MYAGDEISMMIRLQQQTLERVKMVDAKVDEMESVMTTSLKELKKLLEEKNRRSFNLKDSGYEVSK